MRRTGVRAAVLAVLALSACARLGIDPVEPFSADDAPAATAQSLTPPGTDGATSLPVPRSTAGDAPDETAPEGSAGEPAAAPEDAADAAAAPHIYLALQPESGGTTSVVFAIDQSRDNTPSDEPAIRITPEATETDRGRCNPQQLRYYKFPPESAGQPAYGPEEASRGIDARTLPEFMATAVSAEMMARGIAEDLEQTRPQNVCTRKLFEQTIIAATAGQG